jgi:hypothetical protein
MPDVDKVPQLLKVMCGLIHKLDSRNLWFIIARKVFPYKEYLSAPLFIVFAEYNLYIAA